MNATITEGSFAGGHRLVLHDHLDVRPWYVIKLQSKDMCFFEITREMEARFLPEPHYPNTGVLS